MKGPIFSTIPALSAEGGGSIDVSSLSMQWLSRTTKTSTGFLGAGTLFVSHCTTQIIVYKSGYLSTFKYVNPQFKNDIKIEAASQPPLLNIQN